MPLLMQAPVGHVINTSSVNGFWASVGPDTAHSAYSSAKFAVKGFTEALITDFAINAPHLRASVVMPGHIGTSIVINSLKLNSSAADSGLIDVEGMGEMFRDNAPMTAVEAATIILDAVKNEQWRVLVGADAELLDAAVRARPNEAYQPNFFQLFEPQD